MVQVKRIHHQRTNAVFSLSYDGSRGVCISYDVVEWWLPRVKGGRTRELYTWCITLALQEVEDGNYVMTT